MMYRAPLLGAQQSSRPSTSRHLPPPFLPLASPASTAAAPPRPLAPAPQFYLTLAPTPWLDGKHTIFGRVASGMGTLKKLGLVPVDGNDRPLTEVRATLSGSRRLAVAVARVPSGGFLKAHRPPPRRSHRLRATTAGRRATPPRSSSTARTPRAARRSRSRAAAVPAASGCSRWAARRSTAGTSRNNSSGLVRGSATAVAHKKRARFLFRPSMELFVVVVWLNALFFFL